MGKHLHGESIVKDQRRFKYESISTWIYPWRILYDGNDGYLGGRVTSLPIVHGTKTETTED